MGNRTLTQEYALYAYKCIEEVKELNIQSDYKTRVRKLPAMITHNGLLTTLTFLYSKAKFKEDKKGSDKKAPNAEALLLKHIVLWLEFNKKTAIDKQGISSFIEKLAKTDFQHLMLHSKRALTLAQWLKRLAEGEFGDAKNE